MTDLKDMITSFDIETRPMQFGKTEQMRIAIAEASLDRQVLFRTQKPMRNTADLTVAFGKLGNAAEHAALATTGLTVEHRRFMVFSFPEPTGKKKHYLRRQSKRMQRHMDRANRLRSEALFYEHM